MDGNSCKLWAVLNVHGADVCTWVPQSETDLSGSTLSLSHHITEASLSTELNINICLTVFCSPIKRRTPVKATVITTVETCYITHVSPYLSRARLALTDYQYITLRPFHCVLFQCFGNGRCWERHESWSVFQTTFERIASICIIRPVSRSDTKTRANNGGNRGRVQKRIIVH